MKLLHPKTTIERVASFSLLLLLLFVIRLPALPLINFLQGETASPFALLLRIVHFLLQTLTFICPVLTFGFSLELHRKQMRFALGAFLIYAAMELAFQLLYTVLTYYSFAAEVLGEQLLVTVLQWLIFVGATFLLLMLAIWLISISEKKDPSGKFFSLKDPHTLSLFCFSVLFFGEKLIEQLINLFKNASDLLGPSSAQTRTFIVDIIVILLASISAFTVTRLLILPLERDSQN